MVDFVFVRPKTKKHSGKRRKILICKMIRHSIILTHDPAAFNNEVIYLGYQLNTILCGIRYPNLTGF